MSQVDVQGSLKEALYETLNGILSPDRNSRQAAEQQIAALEVTEEFGVHLTEFVVDPNGPLAIRQLASVLLKQYVENHWCSLAEKFRPPEIKPHLKEKIKELLPLGLSESISKVRIAVAYAISKIASWEWPENWPGLFDILVNCLSGANEFAVHGAMRVLTEFARDLTDSHLPNVGAVILREMFRIIQSDTQYSARTRGRAIEIFTTIAGLVADTNLYNHGFIEQHLQPVLPMFCEKFVQCLSMPDSHSCDSGLKTEIIKSINSLVLKLSKQMASYVPQMLPSIWNTLTQSAKIYQEEVVNGDGEINNQEVDSDGEIINFNNLVVAIFELLGTLTDYKKYTSLLYNFLPEIMYYIIFFMQVTEEQIELWTNEPNQFIEDDEQLLTAFNLRISAQELLTTLLSYNAAASVNSLYNAVSKHIEAVNNPQSSSCVTANSKNVWKIYEACMVALHTAKESVVEQHHAGKLHFDIRSFFENVVLTTLNNSGAHPLLLGRCLCIAGKYCKELPAEMSLKFLEATVNGLQESQPICIRISSVKSIYWFCEAADEPNKHLLEMLRPQLPTIFEGLFILANQPMKEILIIVMEAFSILAPLDKAFTASIESKLCPLTIAAFIKFHCDPEIFNLCQDIFKELSENPECIGPLQTRLVPTLISMMNTSPMDKSKNEGIRGVALDILATLVQYSAQPLSSILIDSAFPAACQCILDSNDNTVLQNGGEVIRTYLSVSPQQVIEHRDNEGRTGLQYILQIIAQLLNPQSSEFTATFVDRLVTTLIRKAGNSLGENLDLLLKAVLSKMQRTETPTVMQSLLMIYAHLINSQFDAVLNFLSTVPGPTGESALVFVLTEWASKQQLFFGSYNCKVSTVALCKLLEYGVTQGDSRLNEIMVDGDLITDETSGVRTRGKCRDTPMQWTKIPVLAKIFKLIVIELGSFVEAHFTDDEEEDTDEDEEEDETIVDPGNNSNLHLEDFEDCDDEQDPDIKQDSIYQLNLHQYLRDFFQNFSTHHGFPLFAQYLNQNEKQILNSINIF